MNFRMRLNMFFRSFLLQAGWNYVKFQNLGFAFVMLPFLRKLYCNDPEAQATVLQRYLETFNTHPIMASFCFGAMAKREEHISKAKPISSYREQVTEWISSRRDLSITAASIGDRLFWGALKPLTLLLALFVWMLLGVDFLETTQTWHTSWFYLFSGGIVAFLLYNAIAFFVRWKGLKMGYNYNESSCFGLTRFDWNRAIYNTKRVGMVLAVCLILFGTYRYLSPLPVIDVHFIARAVLVLFFIIITFITRKLRIPSIYLYIATVIIFNLVCLF